MKRFSSIVFAILCALILSGAPAQAVTALDLENTEYSVVLLCTGDAGDYCDKGSTVRDVFVFDDDTFTLESFDDELFGLGDRGEYNDNGFSFDASLEVISDDIVDKYEFQIKGIALLNAVIAGSAEITYSKLKLTGYDKEDEATAYFIGFKK